MPYTIKHASQYPMTNIARPLHEAMKKDGRFTCDLTIAKFDEIHVFYVKLTKPKPYCGQHAGPCVLGGPKKKSRLLEWDDWIEFNNLVNDVLDRAKLSALVWSCPRESLDKGKKFFIRRGLRRRERYDWIEKGWFGRQPIRVWNHGSEDQFAAEPVVVEERAYA